MTKATDIIQNYRLALRDLWNGYFYADPAYRDLGLTGDFDHTVPCLFESLVARRLEYNRLSSSEIFGTDFKIVPRLREIHTLKIDIGFKDRPGSCWMPVPASFKVDEITLTPVDFFDWMPNYWRDFRYLLVTVDRCPRYPEHEGKHGLVEFEEVDVMWVHERIGNEIITTGNPPRAA